MSAIQSQYSPFPSVCLDMYVTKHVDAVHNNVSVTKSSSNVAVIVE